MPHVSVITLRANNKMRSQELHAVLTTCDSWHKPYDNEYTARAVASWQAETLLALNLNTIQSFSISSLFSTWSPTLVSFGCWLPVFSTNYWQTNLPLFIDVRVIDLCFKCNLRRFEWVFCWEVDFDSEGSFIIRRIVLQRECRMSRIWHILMDTIKIKHAPDFDLSNDLF